MSSAGSAGVAALIAYLAFGAHGHATVSASITGSLATVSAGTTAVGSRQQVGANPRPKASACQRCLHPLGTEPSHRTARDLIDEFFASAKKQRQRYSLNALIAIVPDPIDSHLDWAYDGAIEAIRRAEERSNHVIDRFWLPWQVADSTALRGISSDEVAPWRRHPGVMLFRGADPAHHTLSVVFLVGEVPTGGIHKEALLEALRERDSVLSDASFAVDFDTRAIIRLVGPVFSGSAVSLADVLRSWLQKTSHSAVRRIEIVSGGATSSSNRLILGDPPLRFHATVFPDAALQEVAQAAIDDLGIDRSHVALLTEGTTQYGQSQIQIQTAGSRAQTPKATNDSEPIEITFPSNISSLRTEYARHPPALQDGEPAPVARLPLTLADSSRFAEVPAAVSYLTPASTELVLNEIARTLIAHRVRVLGIVATDVRDALFLASEVKRRVPDLQLFMYQSNVLFQRPEYASALRGTLIFSTYPLLAENQAWNRTATNRERLFFGSEIAEAIYNATLLQIDSSVALVDYAPPLLDMAASRPPIWVTVVGRNGISPVMTASPPTPDDARYVWPRYAPSTPTGQETSDPSPGSTLQLLLLDVITMAAMWFLDRQAHGGTRVRRAAGNSELARSRPFAPVALVAQWRAKIRMLSQANPNAKP